MDAILVEGFGVFPTAVQAHVGYALGLAQFGGKHPNAKPWKGEGPGVFEVVEDFRGDTFRAVYTVRFEEAVYVLHAFQKKSTKGIATSEGDKELIGRRLNDAIEDTGGGMAKPEREPVVTTSSGNVFADLGLPNAEEMKAKLRLAFSLNSVLTKRKLTPIQIGEMLGISQAKVVALQGYKLEGFSLKKLMRFATALEHDVVIAIQPRAAKAAKAQVMDRGAA